MAMRTCNKCGMAENPLGRLRFKKSRVDGLIYCENCEPVEHSFDNEEREDLRGSAPSLPHLKPSAGYVVVDCPDCAGGVHRPKIKPCRGCAGYGAVRIEAAMLNVYRPSKTEVLQVLIES